MRPDRGEPPVALDGAAAIVLYKRLTPTWRLRGFMSDGPVAD